MKTENFYPFKNLNYYQVVSAIPKHLLERAKQTQLNRALFFDSENFQLSPSLSINLTKMKNRDYYWLFVKKSTPLVTALSKWERDLSSNDIHWKNYLSKSNLCAKRTNLKNFTLNSFTGYLSPRKNFTSLAYRIILIVLTAANQIQ